MGLKFRNDGDDGAMTPKDATAAVKRAKEVQGRQWAGHTGGTAPTVTEVELAADVLLLARALWEREDDWAAECGTGGQFQQGLDELKEALDGEES